MATTLTQKTPSANDIQTMYATPVWAVEAIKRVREQLAHECDELDRMESHDELIRSVRASGTNAQLVAALANAPSDTDRLRQQALAGSLREQVAADEQAERARREREFWLYAVPEIVKALKNLDAAIAASAPFGKVCEARHDSLSGTLEHVEDPALPLRKIGGMVEQFKEWTRVELGLDV